MSSSDSSLTSSFFDSLAGAAAWVGAAATGAGAAAEPTPDPTVSIKD